MRCEPSSSSPLLSECVCALAHTHGPVPQIMDHCWAAHANVFDDPLNPVERMEDDGLTPQQWTPRRGSESKH